MERSRESAVRDEKPSHFSLSLPRVGQRVHDEEADKLFVFIILPSDSWGGASKGGREEGRIRLQDLMLQVFAFGCCSLQAARAGRSRGL